jgi:TPP-dependent 2-oxoacid decarboxylase
VEIHDGPYNVIKNWNYTGLVDAIHNGEGKCWTTKVSNCSWPKAHKNSLSSWNCC